MALFFSHFNLGDQMTKNITNSFGIMFQGKIGDKTLEELLINKNYEYDYSIWTGFFLFDIFSNDPL